MSFSVAMPLQEILLQVHVEIQVVRQQIPFQRPSPLVDGQLLIQRRVKKKCLRTPTENHSK